GTLTPETLVWRPGQGDWKPLHEVAELLEPPPVEADEGVASEAGETPQAVSGTDPQSPRSNDALTAAARDALRGNWALGVGATLVLFGIQLGAQLVLGAFAEAAPSAFLINVLSFLALTPLELGVVFFFLRLYRERQAEIPQLFHGYRYYGTILGAVFVRNLAVGAPFIPLLLYFNSLGLEQRAATADELAALLALGLPAALIAIILFLRWALVVYLIADNPSTGVLSAFAESRARMLGHKRQLALLYLRFVGWALLTVFTFFIGLLWVVPYQQTALAAFYQDRIGGAAGPAAG
ncbi:MAG: DUF975 family protein, partial [Opitutales bacterium]